MIKKLGGTATLAMLLLVGLCGTLQAQEKEPPAEGCKLYETKSFTEDEQKEAENYANSYSGETGAEVDGVPLVYRSTVRVVKASKTHRVIVVKIWVCPKPAAAGGIVGDPLKPPVIVVKPPQPEPCKPGPDVVTYDPREDHSACDKPERFECGQHYLWWLRNHEHRKQKTEKNQKSSRNIIVPSPQNSSIPIELVPLTLTGASPSGNLSDAIQRLDEITRLWMEQLQQFGNKPSDDDCAKLQEQLEAAKKQLEEEQKAWRDAKANPPTVENATQGVTAAWVRAMAEWQRRLQAAEKKLKEIERRLEQLCTGAGAVEFGPVPGAGGRRNDDRSKPSRPSVPTYDSRTHEYRGGVLIPRVKSDGQSTSGSSNPGTGASQSTPPAPTVTPGVSSADSSSNLQQEMQRQMELQRIFQSMLEAQQQAAKQAVQNMRS